jgi:short-subunit dehydrogenase
MMNIVITGGSKGIGKAMAEKFAAAKNNIFICSRNEKELAVTTNEINKKYSDSVQYFS